MAVNMWYRGISFMKDYTVKYLNYIFLANAKESLVFTNGHKLIKFSQTPEAIKRASWDYRILPSVLVGKVTGGLQYVTFANDLLKKDDDDDHYYDGGDFDVTISLDIRATTIEERDNLVDIVGIYMAHPDAKAYYLRHGIRLPEAPKLGSESEVKETGIDYPIYSTTMSMRMLSRWQEKRPMEERVLSIVLDLETYYDLDETGRISVIDE